MKKNIAIFGVSGFAREVADICYDMQYDTIVFLDEVEPSESATLNGFTILHETAEQIDALHEQGYDFAIGIGDPVVKKKIAERYSALSFPNLIHPSVTFGVNQLEAVQKSKGNIFTAGVRLTNSIEVGDFNTFNLNVTIGHDSKLLGFVTLSPGANVSGNVNIHEGAYIGTNASILQGGNDSPIEVGAYSIVGAGSFVRKSVDPKTTVVGVPAKPR